MNFLSKLLHVCKRLEYYVQISYLVDSMVSSEKQYPLTGAFMDESKKV